MRLCKRCTIPSCLKKTGKETSFSKGHALDAYQEINTTLYSTTTLYSAILYTSSTLHEMIQIRNSQTNGVCIRCVLRADCNSILCHLLHITTTICDETKEKGLNKRDVNEMRIKS